MKIVHFISVLVIGGSALFGGSIQLGTIEIDGGSPEFQRVYKKCAEGDDLSCAELSKKWGVTIKNEVRVHNVKINGKRVVFENSEVDTEEMKKDIQKCKGKVSLSCIKKLYKWADNDSEEAKEVLKNYCLKNHSGIGCYVLGLVTNRDSKKLKYFKLSCKYNFGGGCYKVAEELDNEREQQKFYKKGCQFGSGESCEEFLDGE